MNWTVLAGAAAPRWGLAPLAVGSVLIACGMASVTTGLTGADRFFDSPFGSRFASVCGVGGARALLLLVGVVCIVAGYVVATTTPARPPG